MIQIMVEKIKFLYVILSNRLEIMDSFHISTNKIVDSRQFYYMSVSLIHIYTNYRCKLLLMIPYIIYTNLKLSPNSIPPIQIMIKFPGLKYNHVPQLCVENQRLLD
ncbi:hypothetical protein ACP275_03G043200 [Erythranthe tilingii]